MCLLQKAALRHLRGGTQVAIADAKVNAGGHGDLLDLLDLLLLRCNLIKTFSLHEVEGTVCRARCLVIVVRFL